MAFACATLADAQVEIASSGKMASDRRIDLLSQARAWHQRAFEILSRLREEGALISPEYGSPEAAERKITEVDTAIEKAGGKG